MATYTKGVIVWLGDYGVPESHITKNLFREVTDSAALDTLATALSAYTDAVVFTKNFNSVNELGTAAPGVDACMDRKAQITLRDAATGTPLKFLIPAPKASIEEKTGSGDRVNAATMTAIAAAVSAATGKTLTPLHGKIIQKQ
jgi:hypothetical protein